MVLPAALLCLTVQASSPAVSLRIEVRDAWSGEPVAGALVELADVPRRAFTAADGRVTFGTLAPGPYHVAVRRIGYHPRALHALLGSSGLDLAVVMTAHPVFLAGRRVESVRRLMFGDVVRGDSVHLADRVVTAGALRNNPLLSEPDALLAVAGGHASTRPESPGGLIVLGGASDQVAYLVDGIPVFNPYHTGAVSGGLNPDALQAVGLHVSPRPAADFDALGGVFAGHTRPGAGRTAGSGGLSTSQSRLTIDLPLPTSGGLPADPGMPGGLLLSGRMLFPGLVLPKGEPSEIDADGSDGIAKLAVPVAGGLLQLLAVGLQGSVTAARSELTAADGGPAGRHELEWGSRSQGLMWAGSTRAWQSAARLWRASTSTNVRWLADSGATTVRSSFAEVGGLAQVVRADTAGEWILSARLQMRRSVFERQAGSIHAPLAARQPATLASSHVARRQRVGERIDISLGGVVSGYGDGWRGAPYVDVRFVASDRLSIAVSGARRFQFVQTLRNPESIVANILPVELLVNAGGAMPVARSDMAMLAAEIRPAAGSTILVRGWSRRLSGLALPAAGGDDLAAHSISAGHGRARGFSIDATLAGARFGALASYAVQRVRASVGDTSWTPEAGVTHQLVAGARLFVDPTTSVAVSLAGAAGGRGTPWAGALEWEACNLRDRACEFAGGPFVRDGALGTLALPAYLRFDLGFRKHWHVPIGGRDAQLGAYGTWSNLLGRDNVLTFVNDPGSGKRRVIGMRPAAPLVLGLDWIF